MCHQNLFTDRLSYNEQAEAGLPYSANLLGHSLDHREIVFLNLSGTADFFHFSVKVQTIHTLSKWRLRRRQDDKIFGKYRAMKVKGTQYKTLVLKTERKRRLSESHSGADTIKMLLCSYSSCLVLRLESVMYLRTVTEQQRMKLDAGENCHQYSSVVTAIIL